MDSRVSYMRAVLADCRAALEAEDIPTSQWPEIIAALIIGDAVNGLRRSMSDALRGGRLD